MAFSFPSLNYKQKGLVAEIFYLAVVGLLSPFAIGLQSFSWMSHTLSYTFLTSLQIPVLMLFYRLYLPQTIGKKRYLFGFLLFPFYIVLYELSDKLAMLTLLQLPFIPESYKPNIRYAHPENLFSFHFNEYFGYTALVLLGATSLYVVKLLFKNQHTLETVETEKLKLELNQLKSQLQPHFFFNTINNMYSLSVQNSPKTPQMINDLSEIMRYMLYDTRNEKVPLQQEVDFIKSYIRLENLRHSKDNIIDFTVQGNTTGIEIEPLLFLPLIENTFKHCLHKDLPDKWVKLILVVDESELIFQTSNPKSIKELPLDKQRSGIGLMNVKKRLELFYSGRHELLVHNNDNNNFTVVFTIRLKPAK